MLTVSINLLLAFHYLLKALRERKDHLARWALLAMALAYAAKAALSVSAAE